jgi:hypothetical protein
MAFNINEFRARLTGGGARSNLFEIIINAPPGGYGIAGEPISFKVKASSLPASTVGVVEVPYFGRMSKVGGDRTFEDWNVTVINDEDFDVRDSMERWQKAIASYTTNDMALRSAGATANPNSYVATALVNQYGKEGDIIKVVRMVNIWPTNIGAIELAWENQNQIEQFDVTFALDYFDSRSTV